MAEWLARLLIGFEWLLGILLIVRWRLKKLVYPLSVIVIILFCAELIIQLIYEGNDTNCGCFGNIWVMSPTEALIKNALLVLLLFISVRLSKRSFKNNIWIFIPSFIFAFSLPFVFNPGEIVYPKQIFLDEKKNIDLKMLYTDSINEKPSIDLTKGKHVIAFLSLKCKHCRMAAYKMAVFYSKDPSLPFYFILNGDTTIQNEFFKETKSFQVPHSFFLGPDKFIALSGNDLPSIIMVNNSIVEGKLTYRNFNIESIEKWLGKVK